MPAGQRKRRTVVVVVLVIAAAAAVLASIDVSEDSRAGATTAVALALGVWVRGQWQRWREET